MSPVGQDITVTIKAISESGWTTTSEINTQGTFVVRSTGPCANPAYVQIVPKAFPDYDYTVSGAALDFLPHPEFTVQTQPLADHTLCGELEYTPFFGDDQQPMINDGSEPLTYDPSTRVFTAYTNDDSLVGDIEDYGVVATFKNYPPGPTNPNVSTARNPSGQVEFFEPCLTPNPFTASS